jgi:hypothetical protein
MKKLLIVAVALVSSAAFAGPYGSSGCGLGSMVFEKDNTWWKQVIGSTLNFTGMQSIGITLGTSNCDSPTPAKVSQVSAFVEANQLALANDIAKGQGETITSLSKVYGCNDTAAFGKALKSNYKAIYPSASAPTETVVTEINAVANNTCVASL